MLWGLPIAAYLFFGGLSGGLFAMSALLQLAYGSQFMRSVRTGAAVSVLSLAAGTACLLFEVGAPWKAINLIESFQNVATSWMARGAWILVVCGIIFSAFLLVALVPWPRVGGGRFARRRMARTLNVLGILGIIASVLLMLYTGFLLNDGNGTRAWSTPLVPLLFLASSVDCGIALLVVIVRVKDRPGAHATRLSEVMPRALFASLAVEGTLLAMFVAQSVTTAPSAVWRSPETPVEAIMLAALCVTVASLFAALVLCATRLAASRRFAPSPVTEACSLLGGFALRVFVLFFGLSCAFAASMF